MVMLVIKSCFYLLFFGMSIMTDSNAFVISSNRAVPLQTTTQKQNNRHHQRKQNQRSRTIMFIEDWVADMIDDELHRQGNKKEYEKEWMEKNRNTILHEIKKNQATENPSLLNDESDNMRQKLKDRKMALNDPTRYCADRCVTTGNCDAYEDFFDLDATEVIEFCNDCVLSEDEEPCDIPEAFFHEDNPFNNKLP